LFAPTRRKDALEVFVLARMFAWDDASPVVWVLTTIGLSALEQPAQERRQAFRRFELVVAVRPGLEDPFPARLGVVLSAPGATLPGWNWAEVDVPPLVRWLAVTADDFADWLREGDHFAIGDTLTIGPGGSAWPRSSLDHGVLLSPSIHMLLTGHAPFDGVDDPANTIDFRFWHRQPGTDRFARGFYWLLPVTKAEHDRAARDGTWQMFADLVARKPPDETDDCFTAFDGLRGSE
jgi:hypothetical protein